MGNGLLSHVMLFPNLFFIPLLSGVQIRKKKWNQVISFSTIVSKIGREWASPFHFLPLALKRLAIGGCCFFSSIWSNKEYFFFNSSSSSLLSNFKVGIKFTKLVPSSHEEKKWWCPRDERRGWLGKPQKGERNFRPYSFCVRSSCLFYYKTIFLLSLWLWAPKGTSFSSSALLSAVLEWVEMVQLARKNPVLGTARVIYRQQKCTKCHSA